MPVGVLRLRPRIALNRRECALALPGQRVHAKYLTDAPLPDAAGPGCARGERLAE